MEGLSAISIVLSLTVILAYLTFSQNRHNTEPYRDRYTFEPYNDTEPFHVCLSAAVRLSPEFPLKIRSSEHIYL